MLGLGRKGSATLRASGLQVKPRAKRTFHLSSLADLTLFQPTTIHYSHIGQPSLPVLLLSSFHSFITMGDETPRAPLEDDRSPSSPVSRAYVNRRERQAYEVLNPGEAPCRGGSHCLIPSSESLSPDHLQTHCLPDRPQNPIGQSLAYLPDYWTSIDSNAAPRSCTESPNGPASAQDKVETPVWTTYSSTDAWWANRSRRLYYQGSVRNSNALDSGQQPSQATLTNLCPQAGPSTLPAGKSPAMPAASATDNASMPTQELPGSHIRLMNQLPAFRTPSTSPLSGRARSDGTSLSNPSLSPDLAYSATAIPPVTSPSSGDRLYPLPLASTVYVNSESNRYRLTSSLSSISPLSEPQANTTLSTPNVSPLSDHWPEPERSLPAVYRPSGHQSSVILREAGVSGSTLYSHRDQPTNLSQQEPEMRLDLVRPQAGLIPKRSSQSRGDSVPVPSTQDVVQTNVAHKGMCYSWVVFGA